MNRPRKPKIPQPSGLQGYGDTGVEVFDFRCINPDPTMIWKPYGPAAPWPKDRPATFFQKPYGRADLSEPNLTNATLMISPKGAPMMSDRYVLTDHADSTLPRGTLDGWWSDQVEAFKTFADKPNHGWVVVALWGGIVLLGLRAMSVVKG